MQLGVGRIALMMLQISSFGYIHTFISSSFVILVCDASIGSEATFVAMLDNVVSARTPIGTRDDIFNASSVVDNLLVLGAYSIMSSCS